ncbi:MAG: tetratricopeptide repeat protein [Kiloniellales bacterium]
MTKRCAGRLTACVAAVLICAAAGPAWAAGSGGTSSAPSRDTPSGNTYAEAVRLIEAGNYRAAVPLLEQVVVDAPNSADAWNYLGFSHRKLGQYETALQYYDNALAIDPEHLGANEYMGELYLELGELAKAEERLDVLDGACFFGCAPYYELKEAIAAYKAKTGS